MNRYKFLLKPLFFIFNLLFACWLVLKIEKISPSDFGKHKSLFENTPKSPPLNYKDSCIHAGKHLRNLCTGYRSGKIDGPQLYQELEKFLKTSLLLGKDTAKVNQKVVTIEKKSIKP
jgi:hypothetical protein